MQGAQWGVFTSLPGADIGSAPVPDALGTPGRPQADSDGKTAWSSYAMRTEKTKEGKNPQKQAADVKTFFCK